MRSLLLFMEWSTRTVYWNPLRGRPVAKLPTPVTARLQGILPTSVVIGSEGEGRVEQSVPFIVPAVVKPPVGVMEAGKLLATKVEILLGKFASIKLIKSGVRIVAALPVATPDLRMSMEAKKNVWSLRMGPPKLHAPSFRRKTGTPSD